MRLFLFARGASAWRQNPTETRRAELRECRLGAPVLMDSSMGAASRHARGSLPARTPSRQWNRTACLPPTTTLPSCGRTPRIPEPRRGRNTSLTHATQAPVRKLTTGLAPQQCKSVRIGRP